MNRIIKRIIAVALTIVLAAVSIATDFGLVSLAVDDNTITDASELGDFAHYNGIIFDTFTSYQSDIEGSLAVGGTAKLGTLGWGYDLGAAGSSHYSQYVQIGKYDNPNKYPTLLLGGNTLQIGKSYNNTSNYAVYDGHLVLSESLRAEYAKYNPQMYVGGNGAKTKYAGTDLVNSWFEQQYKRSKNISETLPTANDNHITVAKFGEANSLQTLNLTQYENQNLNSSSRILSLNIVGTSVTLNGWWNQDINLPSSMFDTYDIIVFNFVDAVNVNFSGAILVDGAIFDVNTPAGYNPANSAKLKKMAGKLVWNFPKAENINMQSFSMIGSIIAPEADVYAYGGSVNGMLVSEGFTTESSCELHAFPIHPEIPDIGKEQDPTGSVELIKRDVVENLVLADAKFDLEYAENGSWKPYVSGLTTNTNGRIIVEDLPLGKYRFVEIQAPPGYEMPDSPNHLAEFEITADNADTMQFVQFYNKRKTIDLFFTKVDSDEFGITLEGAEFELYRQGTDGFFHDMGQYISDGNGIVTLTGLTTGVYKLIETKAPDGYDLDYENGGNEIHFEIGEDQQGDLVADLISDAGGILVRRNGLYYIKNERKILPGKDIIIHKVDEDDHNLPIAGAEFKLERQLDSDETVWEPYPAADAAPYVTNTYGYAYIDNLPYGRYRLSEVKAPDDYIIEDDRYIEGAEFNILANETTQITVTVTNKKKTTELTLKKVSAGTYDGTNLEDAQGLPGAVFNLYQIVGRSTVLVQRYVYTDADGMLVLPDLEPGRYFLEELYAPAGYRLLESSVSFLVDLVDNEFIITLFAEDEIAVMDGTGVIVIKNYPVVGQIRLMKIDSAYSFDDSDPNDVQITYEALADVEFEVQKFSYGAWMKYTDFESDHVTASGNLATDADGIIVATEIDAGTYRILERDNPNPGYGANPLAAAFRTDADDPDPGYSADKVIAYFTVSDDNADRTRPMDLGMLDDLEEEEDENNWIIDLIVPNTRIDTSASLDVEITKVDYHDPGQTLEGAVFTLWQITNYQTTSNLEDIPWDDLHLELWQRNIQSGADGKIRLTDLKEGTYTLIESQTPDGYPYYLDVNEVDPNAINPDLYLYATTFQIALDESTGELYIKFIDKFKQEDGSVIWKNEDGSYYDPYGGDASFAITNKKLAFEFRKVSSSDYSAGLDGAEFDLYDLHCLHVHDAACGGLDDPDACTHEHSAVTSLSNPGCYWTLLDSDTSQTVNGEKGAVRFHGLEAGTYRLIESKAPAGYMRPMGAWDITLHDDGTSDIMAVGVVPGFLTADGETYTLLLPNDVSWELPHVGGTGTHDFYYIGAGLFLLGILLLLSRYGYRRRKRKIE